MTNFSATSPSSVSSYNCYQTKHNPRAYKFTYFQVAHRKNFNVVIDPSLQLTFSSNVIDALYVRKTFAVRPGMSSFRWAFSLLVSRESKRSSVGFFAEEEKIAHQPSHKIITFSNIILTAIYSPTWNCLIALYTGSSTSTLFSYRIESLPRKSNWTIMQKQVLILVIHCYMYIANHI
jgi:hypothetical protein